MSKQFESNDGTFGLNAFEDGASLHNPLTELLIGERIIYFTDGTHTIADIVQYIQDERGQPLVLISKKGTTYNWSAITRIGYVTEGDQ